MWIWMKYRIYWKEFMTHMESNILIMIFHLKAFVPNVGRRNRMNRKAMYKLSYGLFVLTAKVAEKDYGCIINTAIQAASGPN